MWWEVGGQGLIRAKWYQQGQSEYTSLDVFRFHESAWEIGEIPNMRSLSRENAGAG